LDCTKLAEEFFTTDKDWAAPDFPDLRPPDHEMVIRYHLPDKLPTEEGVPLPWPLGGEMVEGTFKGRPVKRMQPVDNGMAPVDGWYVKGEIAAAEFRFKLHYFCDARGKTFPCCAGARLTFGLCVPEKDVPLLKDGYAELMKMLAMICFFGIEQENMRRKQRQTG
jgi:hypothetical protein